MEMIAQVMAVIPVRIATVRNAWGVMDAHLAPLLD